MLAPLVLGYSNAIAPCPQQCSKGQEAEALRGHEPPQSMGASTLPHPKVMTFSGFAKKFWSQVKDLAPEWGTLKPKEPSRGNFLKSGDFPKDELTLSCANAPAFHQNR